MQKFERNYRIIFEIGQRDDTLLKLIPEQEIEVSYPFTMKMQTAQGINFSNAGSCALQLYNLSADIQKALFKDNYNNKKYILMSLYAGYQDTMPLVFFGFVNRSDSYRQGGSTEFITEIQADNNSLIALYGFVNETFTQGTDIINIIQSMLKDSYGYSLGYVTSDIPPLKRDKTFIGQTLDLLGREYGGYDVFIDKCELNILGPNDVIPSDGLLVITPESGLLGSPRRAAQFLVIEMLFEPRIKVGQAVELRSDSIKWFNQVYKVQAVEHKGIISPVQNGSLTTKLTLSLGETPFEYLRKSTQTEYEANNTGKWQKPIAQGIGRISSPFGIRRAPTEGASTNHKGIDIAAPLNTPVYAPADGKVITASWRGGYGRAVEIDNGTIDGKRVSSMYAHLNSWSVNNGQIIYKNDIIGYAGSTGNSTGPHLHFEIKEGGIPVNPIKYIGAYG